MRRGSWQSAVSNERKRPNPGGAAIYHISILNMKKPFRWTHDDVLYVHYTYAVPLGVQLSGKCGVSKNTLLNTLLCNLNFRLIQRESVDRFCSSCHWGLVEKIYYCTLCSQPRGSPSPEVLPDLTERPPRFISYLALGSWFLALGSWFFSFLISQFYRLFVHRLTEINHYYFN